MRNFYLLSILLFQIAFYQIGNGQTITCDSVNEALTSKFRFLGSWTPDGHPIYLEASTDSVSAAMIDYVKKTLPENKNLPNSDGSYFSDSVQLNTELTDSSKVFITMVHEGAAWKNTLGFYTYDVNNPPATVYDIDSLVVLFPNVSQPNIVQPGDKVLLGEFPPNTGIGYFLIAQGWIGDTICLPSHIVFTDRRFNTFTSKDYQQQTILLNYQQENKLLLGFEDMQRPDGDNDFNDAVFYVTAEPGSIDTTNIPNIPTAFISGDTTLCSADAPGIFSVSLSGTAPFSIIVNNGIENLSFNNIQDSPFTFETIAKDTVKLISVSDKNNPGLVDGMAIINTSKPTATLGDYNHICGDNNATINVSLTGQGPWLVNYLLNGEAAVAESENENLSIDIASAGTFELQNVSDAYCENSATGTAEVLQQKKPTATISGDTTLCHDQNSVPVNISFIGTAPFSATYTDGTTETKIESPTPSYSFETNEFKTYSLVNANDANCEANVDGMATISDGTKDIQAEIDALDQTCALKDVDLTLTGNTSGLSVEWTSEGVGSFTNTNGLTTIYSPANGEQGDIDFFAELSNGCATTTISKAIHITESVDASFNFSPSEKLLTMMQISFTPENSQYDKYVWDFGDGNTSDAQISSNEYEKGGKYNVSLTVVLEGCEDSSSTKLDILEKNALYVPNAFNPYAENQENQVVKVYGNNIDESGFVFKIVNRWGKTMYITNSFQKANTVGWEGINHKNGEEQELNVFTYFLRGKFTTGDPFERTGTITQIK